MAKAKLNFRQKIREILEKMNQWLKVLSCHWSKAKAKRFSGNEIFARNEGLLETDVFQDRQVALIGLGSLGAPVALDLARCGVGQFVVIDPDRLDTSNISRHPCGFIRNIGKFKTDLLGNDILDINPRAVVHRHRLKVDWNTAEQVRKIIEHADIVIVTADGPGVVSVMNKLCLEEGIGFLWSGCFRRAYGGQILKIDPGETACYECFRENLPEDDDREISSERSANAPAYSDVEIKAEPGLGVDITPIATMTSKLAIQHLIKGKESMLHSLDEDLDCNFYMFFNRREGRATEFIPMSDQIGGLRIGCWLGIKMPHYDKCLSCGNPTLENALDTGSKQNELLRRQYNAIQGGKSL